MSVDLDALRTLAAESRREMAMPIGSPLSATEKLSDALTPDLALALIEAVQALSVYADARNWGISRDDLNYRVVSWIGPGAEKDGMPDAMETARVALAPFAGASTEANA